MAKMYYYNELELPALPEWDKETYPYAVILEGNNLTCKALLYVGTKPFTYERDVSGIMFVFGAMSTDDFMVSSCSLTDEWNALHDQGYGEKFTGVSWTNHDIMNTEDGSVYLPASDPVPVTPTPIPSDAYIVKGGKVYKVKGGSAQSIMTFDSVDEMNATSAPDGTIALVPSEGESGGGLPVVELATQPTEEGSALTDSENATMKAAFTKGLPVVIKFDRSGESMLISASMIFELASVTYNDATTHVFANVDAQAKVNYSVMSTDGDTWIFMQTTWE